MPVNIYDDDFGTAPGLEISLKYVEGGLVVISCSMNGQQFQSYNPTTQDHAAEACKYLTQGLSPPRALFRRGERVR